MAKPDLAALVREIQIEMGLLDWTIAIDYVADLVNDAGQAVYGLCQRFLDNKQATILIRDPESPLPEGAEAKSPLEILLHEMTHVRLANLAADPSELNEEQATWPLAELLYRKWGTAEARSMLRAMAVPGSTRGQVIARAMSARAPGARAPNRRHMNKTEYARALRAALAMEGDEQKGALNALAAQMEEEPEPKSEKGEGQAQRAAEAEPEKKEPPKEQRAQMIPASEIETRAARAARAAAAEVLERSQLITSNRDRMTDAQASLFARLPLSDVKEQIAALPPKGEERAAKLKVDPVGAPRVDMDDDTRHAIARVDDMMGVGGRPVVAFSIDRRGMSISNLVEVRLDAKGRAAQPVKES